MPVYVCVCVSVCVFQVFCCIQKERIIKVFYKDNFPRKKSHDLLKKFWTANTKKVSLVNKGFWKFDIQGPPPIFLSHRMQWLLLKCIVILNNWQSLNALLIIWVTLQSSIYRKSNDLHQIECIDVKQKSNLRFCCETIQSQRLIFIHAKNSFILKSLCSQFRCIFNHFL